MGARTADARDEAATSPDGTVDGTSPLGGGGESASLLDKLDRVLAAAGSNDSGAGSATRGGSGSGKATPGAGDDPVPDPLSGAGENTSALDSDGGGLADEIERQGFRP